MTVAPRFAAPCDTVAGMSFDIHTDIEIEASPERVWTTLTDGAALRTWNPVLTRLDGPLVVGGRIRVNIESGRLRLPLIVKVTKAEPNRALEWAGGLPGVFRARHGFAIEPLGDRRVRFVHYEHFSGLAVRLLRRILAAIGRDYERMNEALKDQAER